MMLRHTVILSTLSLVTMILIDRALGARAELLNAWSVVERLLGRAPTAGPSQVAASLGALGELVIVLIANVTIGILLAGAVRLAARLLN